MTGLAAENERLRAALVEATRGLAERDQQAAATAEILRAISRTPANVSSVLDSIVRAVAALCDAEDVLVARAEGGTFRIAASYGPLAAELRALVVELTGAPVFRLTRGLTIGRAIVDGRVVRVEDLGTDPDFPDVKVFVQRTGVRSSLGVPLLRDGAALGSIAVYRREVRPFTDRQAALLETFADQVVIALENARMFSELQESNATLKEALEQQTATAEVLQVIAGAPTDLQRVLDTICASAARLLDTDYAEVWRREPDAIACIARAGTFEYLRGGERVVRTPVGIRTPLDQRRLSVRAVLEARTVHVEDMANSDDFPHARGGPQRTALAVPLLREGSAIGTITARRGEVRPFTPAQIALLESFADQAVIAIENARLFSELQERLAEQTATSDILRAIAAAPTDLAAVMQTILERAVALCGAADGTVRLIEGDDVVNVATMGDYGQRFVPGSRVRRPTPGDPTHPWADKEATRAMREQRTLYHPDTRLSDEPGMAERGILSQIYVPLPGDGEGLGHICIRAREANAFSPSQIRLVETFARQASIAVSNTRLFNELQQTNRTLKEALDQQTATAEILQVISRSPSDLQRVLDTIVERAARLCDASRASLYQYENGRLEVRAWTGYGADLVEAQRRGGLPGGPPVRGSIRGRAFLERRTVHVPDLEAAWTEFPESRPSRRTGAASQLSAPLLRGGEAIGVITVNRTVAGQFSDAQVRLLETFADQAVIAIENVRLFAELQARDERRRQELERASAIQQRLLPSSIEGWPGVLEIAHRFRAAVETSGDFYDVLALPAPEKGGLEPLQIAVGDVAGKGMSAALVTALARSALHTSASVPTRMVSPAGALREAGARLHRDVGAGHFVACALAVLEPPGRHNRGPLLRLANAAQVPVLLIRDGEAKEVEPPGYRLPLGAEDDGAYEDAKVELRAGDVVVFSSDGVVEAPARAAAEAPPHLAASERAGELFGFARLAASASHWSRQGEGAEDVAAGMWNDLTAWCGEESHHDDVTLLVLRVAGDASA